MHMAPLLLYAGLFHGLLPRIEARYKLKSSLKDKSSLNRWRAESTELWQQIYQQFLFKPPIPDDVKESKLLWQTKWFKISLGIRIVR